MKNLGTPPLKIGGWLVVLAVSLILNLTGSLSNIIFTVINMIRFSVAPFLRLDNFLYFIAILFCIFVTVCFFKKWKHFKYIYFGFWIYVLLYSLVLIIFVSGYILNVISIIVGALWVCYIIFSRRVKMTFVYNWDRAVDKEFLYYKNYRQKNEKA